MNDPKQRGDYWLLAVALLFAWFAPISTPAASIVWTNTAGGNWSATNNWSPNQVPASADIAIITNAGNYTVTLNVSSAVAGLILGASGLGTTQVFLINGPTFTLNGQATVSSNGVFNFESGNLAGTIMLTGVLNAQGGVLDTSGSLTVAGNGTLNLAGPGDFQIEGLLTNNGTVNWLGGEVQVINNNTTNYQGAIWNEPGAQWNIECSGEPLSDYFGGGSEIFNNAGLLCKTNVSGATSVSTYLNNSGGTVQAQTGTIQITGGSNLGGTFQAASGAAIDFTAGNYLWNGSADFEGPGMVAITGGSVTVTTYITTPLAVSGVILTNLSNLGGSADLTNVTIQDAETIVGTINWSGGTVSGSGSLTVSEGGILDISGPANFNLDGPMTNNGTVNWLGGEVQVINNNTANYQGVIWNEPGAHWNIECSGDPLSDYFQTGYEVFNNAGLLCKTNVSGATSVSTYLNNSGGTVQAQTGTIQITGGSNLGGTFQAASGAAIDFTAGNYLWNGSADFEGPGMVAITGGSVTVTTYITTPLAVSGVILTNLSNLGGSADLTNVTIQDAETIVGTINWSGGTVSGSGSLTVSEGGILDISGPANFNLDGPMTNNGTVNWSGGEVVVANDKTANYQGVIWNEPGAQWNIECSGEPLSDYFGGGSEIFNNAGLLCKTNLSGTTTVTTYLNNSGGTAQAQTGTMQINGGCNLTGTFQAASGAAIDFTAGNYFWNGTAVFDGPGVVAITGGSVTVTTYITSPLAVSGVILTNLSNLGGTAYLTNVTIQDAETIVGTINWSGGTVSGSSSLTVSEGGALNVDGPGNFVIDAPLTNNGTVNWLGGLVQVANNKTSSYQGAIWNEPGAQWNIECSGDQLSGYFGNGDEIFNNAGLLCKTNVSGTTSVSTYLNNNDGTVQAQIGTIQITAGSNLGGTFQAVSGAAIDFTAGNYFWNGTAVFDGPGVVAITGGSVTVTTYITSPLAVSGVILTNLSNLGGTAYLTNVTIQDAETIVGTINWSGGTVSGSSSLTVSEGGALNVDGPGNFVIDAPLTNNGTVNWLGGLVQVANNKTSSYQGAIWNEPGAQWNIECSGEILSDYFGNGDEIFNNAGLLCKTNAGGTTTISTYLNNDTGILDSEIGTIDLNGGYTLGAASTLRFGLNSPASFGQISLLDTASLNGMLDVHLNGGYVPVENSAFTILNYGSFTGGFNTTNLPSGLTWQTTYGGTELTIKDVTIGPIVPALTVSRSPPNMILSWPTNSSAFVLNRTASLKLPITWIPITSGISVIGTNNTITIDASSGNQYYILIAP